MTLQLDRPSHEVGIAAEEWDGFNEALSRILLGEPAEDDQAGQDAGVPGPGQAAA